MSNDELESWRRRERSRRVQSPDQLMTVQEVAEYLRVPVGTLYNWHYLGKGPACAKIGRHLRYRRTVVEAWVTEQIQLDGAERGNGR